DSAGSAYLTGYTYSTDLPTANPFQNANTGSGGVAFITKLDAAGSALVYSTYLGGTSSSEGDGIAVDTGGNAYIVGQTRSADFPVTNAFQSVKGIGFTADAFVTKLNAAGDNLV